MVLSLGGIIVHLYFTQFKQKDYHNYNVYLIHVYLKPERLVVHLFGKVKSHRFVTI